MSFPKPEYIQNFLEEKLGRGKAKEGISLLTEDDLARQHDMDLEAGRDDGKFLKPPRLRQNCNNNRSASPASSAFSESDENRNRGYYSSSEVEKRKHHSVASDADCDTDESEAIGHNKLSSKPIGKKKIFGKKPKGDITPLKTNGRSNKVYGGTSEVEIDCSKTLASYSPGRIKGILKAGTSHSKEYKQMLNPSSHEESSSNGKRKKSDHGHDHEKKEQGYQRAHHHSAGEEEQAGSSRRHSSMSAESEHCHEFDEEKAEDETRKRKKAMQKLLIATGLSFLFMVGEVVGGYLANSLAVMTDASHLLTDVSSFLISIIALKMAARPISQKMTFGWHRAEIIGAIISVLAIWIVTGVLVYFAVMRLLTNKYEVNGRNMLITASLAVGFNIVMGLVLHEHSHTHGHSHGGHSHSHDHGDDHNHDRDHDEAGTAAQEENVSSSDTGNVNVRAAFIHVIGDLLQSLGVLTAAFIIYFKPEYKIADPICTFLFSVFVLATTITILKDTIVVIMEGTPVGIEYVVVKNKLLEIEGVTAVHDLRLWSLTLNQTVMSAHLAVDKAANHNEVLKKATRKLKSLYNFHSLTLQVEYYSEDMDECKKCQPA